MSFPKLEQVEAKLQAIFAEARTDDGDYDLSQVTTISGSDAEKVEEIQRLNSELQRLAAIDQGARNATGAGREPGDARPLDHGQTAALKDRQRLSNSDSVAAWAQARGDDRGDELASGVTADEAWGAWFRGYVTGDWRDYRGMVKAQMGTSPDSDGGFLVPSPLSTDVIDRLRAATPIFAAGAQTVPMTAKTLDVARIGGDVDTSWHAENATITATQPSIEQVQFVAKTLPVLVKASRELAEDASNTGAVVAQSIAGATSVAVTEAALRGDGASNNPTGILNQTGVASTELGAGDGGDAHYDDVVDALRDIELANAFANAGIFNPRTKASLGKLKDANNNYLEAPEAFANLAKFATTAIPNDLTTGTSTDTTEIYVGDFTKLLIGMRTELRIEPLRERFADDGQVAWLSWLRLDVQLEHPAGFHVITGVTN